MFKEPKQAYAEAFKCAPCGESRKSKGDGARAVACDHGDSLKRGGWWPHAANVQTRRSPLSVLYLCATFVPFSSTASNGSNAGASDLSSCTASALV